MRTDLISPRKIRDRQITEAEANILVGVPANFDSLNSLVANSQRDMGVFYTRKRETDTQIVDALDEIYATADAIQSIPNSNGTAIDKFTRVLDTDLRNAMDNITSMDYYRGNMLYALDNAAAANKDIEQRTAAHRQPLEVLQHAVRTHPLANKKAKIAVSADHWLTFTTEPLVLRPSSNPYLCIDEGRIPYVPIGAMTICLNLKNGEVALYPASRRAITRSAYDGKQTSHPHELSRHHPCLGDFGPPLAEALETGDLMMALDTLQAFLKQAATDDAAGKHWIKWIIPEDRINNGRNWDIFKQLYVQEGSEYVQYRTSPDGTVRRIVSIPTPPVVLIDNVSPPQALWTFWDGRGIPATGDIALVDGNLTFLAWYNDILFGSRSRHPADIDFVPNAFSINDANNTLSVILPDQQFAAYLRMYRNFTIDEHAQWAWNLWEHNRPQAETYNPRLISSDSTWLVRGEAKLMGPMSRSYPIEPTKTLGPTIDAMSGWPDGLVSVTPSETEFPQAALIPYEMTSNHDDIKIGMLFRSYMVISYGPRNYEYGVITKLPWMASEISNTMSKRLILGTTYLTPDEPRIIKFIHNCAYTERDLSARRAHEIFRQWIMCWDKQKMEEKHFTPLMWSIYQREKALIEVERDHALANARSDGRTFTPGATPTHVETPSMFNAAANNAVRIDFRDGEFVTIYAEQSHEPQ